MKAHSTHIKVDGRTYSGTFTVDRKVLTVTTSYGRKAAQVELQMTHEALAHRLLHELVQEEKSRKGSTL
jgi:hypothetical protein